MNGLAYDEGADGYVIPQAPSDVWNSHREARVPLIIGYTSQDTSATISGAPAPDAKTSPEEATAWKKRILELFFAKSPDLLERALQIHGLHEGPNEVSTYPPYGTPAQQLGVDLNHRCSSILSASLHASVAPTWLYEFTRTTAGRPPLHGAELSYVFGYDNLGDAASGAQSEIIQGYWTNFARTGDPNGPGLPPWPKYTVAAKPSMELSDEGPLQRSASRAAACAPQIEKYTRNPKILSDGDGTFVRGPGNNPR